MIFQSYYYEYDPVFSFLPTLISVAIRIGIAVWIAKDAQKRSMEPTIYVVLTCLCGCCIGGIVYLISASSHPTQPDNFQQPSFNGNQGPIYGQQPPTTYGQPQQPQQPQQQYQPPSSASTTIPSMNKVFCPICGSENQKGAKFCSTCGADLH